MSKMCNKCLHYYDDNLDKCPYCNKEIEYNIKNPFMELKNDNNSYVNLDSIKEIEEVRKLKTPAPNEEKIESINGTLKEEKKDDIFFVNDKKPLVEDKKKETKNNKIVKKKEKINIYSYLILVLSFILLFITVLSSVISFNLMVLIHYGITSILLICTYRFSLDSKTGYYIGIISACSMIAMILEKDYTNFIVGIYLFFASFVKLIKK